MSEIEQPQIYLITPAEIDLNVFPAQLASVLAAVPVACLRMALATTDETLLIQTGDALREVAHAADVSLVIDRHWQLAERLGLDGVHLPDGLRQVRAARKALGPDAIVGAFCGASRHDGIATAEAGADYVALGPCAPTALGDGSFAEHDLFAWWSEMIEVPVVAEGALTAEGIADLAPVTDFVAVGPEIWGAPDPVAALKSLVAAIL